MNHFHTLHTIAPNELAPGFHARILHSETMTFVYWDIDAGAILPLHQHPQEQVAHMLLGEFELMIGSETKTMQAGMVAVIPGNTPHTGRAITACQILDVFYPTREDYRF